MTVRRGYCPGVSHRAASKANPTIIGKLLGHTQAATTARYAHLDADPLRSASEVIGGRIAAAMGEQFKVASTLSLETDTPTAIHNVS
jgi:hypothetical protein